MASKAHTTVVTTSEPPGRYSGETLGDDPPCPPASSQATSPPTRTQPIDWRGSQSLA